MKKLSYLVFSAFYLTVAPHVHAASINVVHTSPDTVTVIGQFAGENCYGIGKEYSGGIVLSSRGGTPDGKIHLDLSQAKIAATLNDKPVSGTRMQRQPVPAWQELFLLADPKLTLDKTDVIKLTVTGAKINVPGDLAIEIGYGDPDPRGSTEMMCHWDSLGDGHQNITVSYVYPSPKPTVLPSPSMSVSPSPVGLLPSSTPTDIPIQSQGYMRSPLYEFINNIWLRFSLFLHSFKK
jgi:hypothetical protein